MRSLLKAPVINPHATLITLFMNAILEMATDQDELETFRRDTEEVWKYMPLSPTLRGSYDAGLIVKDSGRLLIRDDNKSFDR